MAFEPTPESSKVYPSGSALATTLEPIVPLAPPRFSITTLCPRRSASRLPNMRPTASVLPPGGKGTTIRIGLFGQSVSCACAVGSAIADTAVATAMAANPVRRRSAKVRRARGSDVFIGVSCMVVFEGKRVIYDVIHLHDVRYGIVRTSQWPSLDTLP